jgi:hypothetical protein
MLDVTRRWFEFIFSIVSCVDNLDKDIGGLVLLILHSDRHDMIVGQFFNRSKEIYCVRCDREMV